MKTVYVVLCAAAAWAFAVGYVAAEESASLTLVINEIEINPPGPDTDAEWVELLNLGAESVDLLGWGLTYDYPAAGVSWIDQSIVLRPGERYVFVYPGLRLRNAAAKVVQLIDPAGVVLDWTGTFVDTQNDDSTWQRYPDGGDPLFPDLWIFGPLTRGKANG
jgi:hypothetical protein